MLCAWHRLYRLRQSLQPIASGAPFAPRAAQLATPTSAHATVAPSTTRHPPSSPLLACAAITAAIARPSAIGAATFSAAVIPLHF